MIIATMLAAATLMPVAPLPSCRPYTAGASLAEGARNGAELATIWPTDWTKRSRLSDTIVRPDELRRFVAALACTASWPGEEERTIAMALPLFANKRHGNAAFLALDGLARSSGAPGPLRAAAHGFRARMRHAVAQAHDKM
jgi:hypothetical protein